MKTVLYGVAVIVALSGAIFFLQGLRVLPSQVMYGKPEWVIIGAIMVVAGATLSVFVKWRGNKNARER